MHITLCARSKILQLLEPGKSFRIQATGSALAGSHVDLIINAEVLAGDSTISTNPSVIADVQTITILGGRSIDFNYDTNEFIISNRGKE